MSKEVMIPEGVAVPAHLQQGAPVETGLVTSGEALPRVSLKQGRFRFILDGEEAKILPAGAPLKAVIIGVSPKVGCSKVYYEGAYEPGSDEPPDCSSSDGVYPDTNINDPMSDMCQTCPMNAWNTGKKSDGSPSKGKACRDTKILYIVGPPSEKNPDGLGEMLLQLRVPVMSLKSLSQLGHALEKRRIPAYAVIIKMTFEDSTDWPQLKFEFDSFLSESAFAKAKKRAESEELRRLVKDPAVVAQNPPAAIPEKPQHLQEEAPAEEPKVETQTQTAAPTEEAVDIGSLWPEESDATPPVNNQKQAAEPPVQESVQPVVFKGPGQNPADGLWYDAAGTVWNPAIHGTAAGGGPAFKKDGTFKAKRGLKTTNTPPASSGAGTTTQPPAQTAAPPTQATEDPLAGWAD